MGASSDATRATESQKLLNYGFQNFEALQLYRKNQPVGQHPPVWKGQQATVAAGVAAAGRGRTIEQVQGRHPPSIPIPTRF